MDDTIFKKIYVSIESEEQLFWQLQFVFHIEYENKNRPLEPDTRQVSSHYDCT